MKKIIVISVLFIVCLLADNKPKIELRVNQQMDSTYVVVYNDSTEYKFRSKEGAEQFLAIDTSANMDVYPVYINGQLHFILNY